jgi:hypothetical protein
MIRIISKSTLLALLSLLLLQACQAIVPPVPTISGDKEAAERNFCGDGTCQKPENPHNCPSDCNAPIEPTETSSPKATKSAPTQAASRNTPVLYLGIMVHLEGWDDDKNQDKFEQHVRLIREYADLFEAYGGKLTLESKEVTDGAIRWGDNVLLEMEQRGHGIGVHADIGGQRDYDCDRFARDLQQERLQLESLGVTVRHVSGNTSHCDWVAATVEAGYLFTTGQVAYSVMSMPIDQRPPEYRDCPDPSSCHQVFPPDLEDRIHPWRAISGADWLTHNPDGQLVILASSQGLTCMEEELTHNNTRGCSFTSADIDYFIQELDDAIALSEPDQVNIFYLSWSLGSQIDKALLEEWLKRVQPYLQSGQVEWKTLPEMYDAYIQWEQGH